MKVINTPKSPRNPSAFPTNRKEDYSHGMSFRDYVAAAALAMGEGVYSNLPEEVAMNCYAIADAFLKEREK